MEINDNHINWLRYANAGMLTPGNVYCINYAISHLSTNAPVIEIGSFCGLSTNVINYFLRKHSKKNKIINADKWIFENLHEFNTMDVSIDEYRQFIKKTYIRNIQMFSKHNLPYTIEEFSDDFFNYWKNNATTLDILERTVTLGGPISFAYIDGNHTYEFAKRDFENVDQFLEIGGFIFFDDSYESSPFGCAKLMGEILRSRKYKLVLKNPNYLFQKMF